MSRFVVAVLGAIVEVDVPSSVNGLVSDMLGDLLCDGAAPAEMQRITWRQKPGGSWSLRLPSASKLTRLSLSDVVAETLVELNRIASSNAAARSVALHASTFVDDGHAVAMCGISGAGKSTAVAAAVSSGRGFLGDEVCSVSPGDWTAVPYLRPIGLRAAGAQAVGIEIPTVDPNPFAHVYPYRVAASSLVRRPIPLRLVALVHRRPGATAMDRLDPAHALYRLATLTLGAPGLERQTFRMLDQMVRSVAVVELGYENSAVAVEALALEARRCGS